MQPPSAKLIFILLYFIAFDHPRVRLHFASLMLNLRSGTSAGIVPLQLNAGTNGRSPGYPLVTA